MDDPTGFFVGWSTLSLINAGLAQSKNRSGLITGSSSDNGLASPHLPIGPHKKIIPASITQPMAGFEAPTWLR